MSKSLRCPNQLQLSGFGTLHKHDAVPDPTPYFFFPHTIQPTFVDWIVETCGKSTQGLDHRGLVALLQVITLPFAPMLKQHPSHMLSPHCRHEGSASARHLRHRSDVLNTRLIGFDHRNLGQVSTLFCSRTRSRRCRPRSRWPRCLGSPWLMLGDAS